VPNGLQQLAGRLTAAGEIGLHHQYLILSLTLILILTLKLSLTLTLQFVRANKMESSSSYKRWGGCPGRGGNCPGRGLVINGGWLPEGYRPGKWMSKGVIVRAPTFDHRVINLTAEFSVVGQQFVTYFTAVFLRSCGVTWSLVMSVGRPITRKTSASSLSRPQNGDRTCYRTL
jgi:hypothetical protein